MNGIIYKATNTVNGMLYIGRTINDLNQRIAQHYCSKNGIFPKALRKYGKENFTFTVIDAADNLTDLNDSEIFWIKFYNTSYPSGYNLTVGGEGSAGHFHSAEARKKMSDALKGKCSDKQRAALLRRGPHSEEHKRKIGLAGIGRVVPDDVRKKISQTLKGHGHSDETKEKIRQSLLGKKLSKEHKSKISNGLNVYYGNELAGVRGQDINMEYYIAEAEKLVRPLRG